MSEKAKSTSEESLQGLLAAIFGVIFLATMKFAPPVILGMTMGLLVFAGARSAQGFARVRAHALGLVCFGLVLFVLVGLPTELGAARIRFPGVLLFWEAFAAFVGDSVRWWNQGVGGLFRGLRISPQKVTALSVSQYFWISWPAAAISAVLSDGMKRLKSGEWAHGGAAMAWPASAVHAVYVFAFRTWVDQGRDDFTKHERGGVRGALRAASGAVLFLGVGALVASYLVSKIPYVELGAAVVLLLLAPGAGLAVGLLVGLVQWTLGSVNFSHLLTKKISDGFKLGRDARNRSYVLTPQNLAHHIEIVASSGAGKTNLIKNLLLDRIRRGHGVVFLDLKADFDVVKWLVGVTAWAKREEDLRLVSLADAEISVPYNPIAGGSAHEIHSQLMNAWTWSDDYYRSIASVALMALLQGLCEWRDRRGEKFSIGHIYQLLSEPGALRAFTERMAAQDFPSASELARLAERLDRPSERKELAGLIANLNQILYSAAGKLITKDVEQGSSLDFREATDEGRIVYFLLNSLKLKESAKVLGKLVLQDLMRVIGDRYAGDREGGGRPITLIIDEFAAFAVPEFIEFMDRARGAGCGIVIAHQSRADLAAISTEFLKRVETNASTKIVGSLEDADDRDYYAKILGTRTAKKETVQVADGFFGASPTGMKSVREVEEFIVHPNEWVNLGRGTVFTVSRTVDHQHGFVRVPLAPEVPKGPRAEVVERLRAIRSRFMSASRDEYIRLDTSVMPSEVTPVVGAKPGLAIKPHEPKKITETPKQGSALWD